MYWHKKKIDYDILIPPINKQFKNFTKSIRVLTWITRLILWLTSGVGS